MKREIIILILSILLILPIITPAEVCGGTISNFEPTVFEDCSDYLSTNPCFKASDGNTVTGWVGAYSVKPIEPKWIYGDLGERKCLRRIRIRLRGDENFMWKPQTMNIQVSDNAVDWITIYPGWRVNSVNTWETLTVPETKTRYVRFRITDCNYWFYECGLFDCDWIFEPNGNNCNIKEFQFKTRDICTTQCSGKECGDDACGGTCPPGCSNPHGTTTCSAVGLCQPICSQDWGNCDVDNTNGCETDLKTTTNCGSCGNTCTGTQLCSEGLCISPASAYWANMLGQPITGAQIGDTVQMIYTLTDSTTFEIREDDTLNDDNIRTGAEAITGNIINGKAIGKFTITQQEFDKGFADELDTNVELYFQIGSQTSNNLIVQENSYDNSLPSVTITNPLLNDKFKTQTNVNFEQFAEDEDDDLKLTWNFGDNTRETLINCLTTTNCDTTHSYSNSGTKTITLRAEEMTRPKTAIDTTDIFIYKPGINPFPIITIPAMNFIFQTHDVDFDASSSFVAECSSVCPPSKTCYTVADLQCYDFPKTEPTDIPNNYDLWFNWTFTEGFERFGIWSVNKNQVVTFAKTFFQPTTHQAHLKLGYNIPPFNPNNIQWSDQVYTEFTISTVNPQCTIEDEISYWTYWDSGTGQLITEEVTDEATNCFKNNGQPSPTCCPNNKRECVTSGADAGKCLGTSHEFSCSDYEDETSCENFHLETAERSVDLMTKENNYCGSTQSEFDSDTGETCWWIIENCRCEWDTTDSTCEATYSRSDETCGLSTGEGEGTCTFRTVSQTGDCATDDFVIYDWIATWSGDPADTPDDCTAQTKQFACDDVIKMPFFTLLNFITTFISITLIYAFLILRKKI